MTIDYFYLTSISFIILVIGKGKEVYTNLLNFKCTTINFKDYYGRNWLKAKRLYNDSYLRTSLYSFTCNKVYNATVNNIL